MDIIHTIDIPALDGLRPPDVNAVVLLELVKSLKPTTLGRQKALDRLQAILTQTVATAHNCEQSAHQLTTQQEKVTQPSSKL